MNIILKTMVSHPAEFPWLWMMFEEAYPFVDRILVCEFNVTHSGLPKKLYFQDALTEFRNQFPKLDYLVGRDLPLLRRNALGPADHHWNETLMRSWFSSQIRLRPVDIVVSLDSDEVLYSSTYAWLLENMKPWSRGVRFRLHQFFYRPNFLWTNTEFTSPIARPAWPTVLKNYDNWRDDGRLLQGHWGAHFSWCIPISRMVTKLREYSHASEFSRFANPELLRDSRRNREYPFEKDRAFDLDVIPHDSEILPKSFMKYMHLLDADVIGEEGLDW